MLIFAQQVFSLLTTNAGSLAYHLVLAFSILAAILGVLNPWRAASSLPIEPDTRRTLFGLGALLALRLLLFFAASLAWQQAINSARLLPALERSIDLLSLILLSWLWISPSAGRLVDGAYACLAVLLILGTVFSISSGFGLVAEQAFNRSTLDTYVQALGLAMAFSSALLLLARRPPAWPTGFGMFLLLGAGHLLHLLIPISADYPGSVRLAQMMAFPLLLALPFRSAPLEATPVVSLPSSSEPGIGVPADRTKTAIHSLVLSWVAADDPRQAGEQLSAALARQLQADICLFLWPPDADGQVVARYGYDLIHKLALPDLVFDAGSLPVTSLAFQQGRVLRLPGNSTVPDLRTLAQKLSLQRSGALLSVSVAAQGQPVLQVVMLAPFSGRRWSQQDQVYLTRIAEPLAQILQRNQLMSQIQVELAQSRQALQTLQDQAARIENDRTKLIELVSLLRHEPDGSPAAASDPDKGNQGNGA